MLTNQCSAVKDFFVKILCYTKGLGGIPILVGDVSYRNVFVIIIFIMLFIDACKLIALSGYFGFAILPQRGCRHS